MAHYSRRWSKAAVFAALLALAVVVSLLPTSWTRPLRALGQPLRWVTGPAAAATRAAARTSERWAEGELHPAMARLQAENEQLRRQAGHFALQIEQLRTELDALAGVRDALNDANARILVARVIAPLSDPQRDALRIDRGSLQGAAVGQWAAAGKPVFDDDVSGRELLARQWLVGRIVEVHPHESVVQLASDRDFRVAVGLARPKDDGGWEVLPAELPLEGAGGGRMAIRQATEDYGAMGAVFAVVRRSAALPMPMAIGRVAASERLDATQLHFDLEVRPWSSPRLLDHIYIVSP